MRLSARAPARSPRPAPSPARNTRSSTALARPVTTTRAKLSKSTSKSVSKKETTPKPAAKSAIKHPEKATEKAAKPALPSLVAAAAEKPAAAPPSSNVPPPGPRFGSMAPRQIIPLHELVAFEVGDKCVHPAHGVGVITAIDELELGGTKGLFYRLLIIDNGLKLLVPVQAAAHAGLRPIMSAKDADRVLETLKAREVAVDVQPWSRRFRTYTEMVKSGLAIEIAKVLRDISRLRSDKELSFGERRLLDQARSLLLKELSLAKNVSEDSMKEKLEKMFAEAI